MRSSTTTYCFSGFNTSGPASSTEEEEEGDLTTMVGQLREQSGAVYNDKQQPDTSKIQSLQGADQSVDSEQTEVDCQKVPFSDSSDSLRDQSNPDAIIGKSGVPFVHGSSSVFESTSSGHSLDLSLKYSGKLSDTQSTAYSQRIIANSPASSTEQSSQKLHLKRSLSMEELGSFGVMNEQSSKRRKSPLGHYINEGMASKSLSTETLSLG